MSPPPPRGHGRDAHAGPEGESASVHRHRREPPRGVRVAVLTVSDTRSLAADRGGDLLVALLEEAGHRVVSRDLATDDAEAIRAAAHRALAEDEEAAQPGEGALRSSW